MSSEARERALRTLRDHENRSHSAIHNAIVDLRRNAELGDERILHPFLNHYDPMVVAATLYTLFEVHNQQRALRPLIEKLAGGDARDDMEMPIQCMAISCLADFGAEDAAAVDRLLEVGESQVASEAPRERAWYELARLYGVELQRDALEEMLQHPQSEASEGICERIRKAIADARAGS